MKTLINLATLRRGGGMTHVNAFLPELVKLLPEAPSIFVPEALNSWASNFTSSVLTHRIPEGSVRLAFTQQLTARWHARKSDVVLSVMNTGPIKLPNFHIIWACNVSHFVKTRQVTERIQNCTVMHSMNQCDLCIFPSEAARNMAEVAGFDNKSTILYHPMRVTRGHWSKPSQENKLRIFVPTSYSAHKNLDLLPKVSRILSDKKITHQFDVTIEKQNAANALKVSPHVNFIGRYPSHELIKIVNCYDVAFAPSLLESYSYSVAELESLGMPLAVSNIPVHREISQYATQFDPANALQAANALTTAAQKTPVAHTSKFISTPNEYAGRIVECMSAQSN